MTRGGDVEGGWGEVPVDSRVTADDGAGVDVDRMIAVIEAARREAEGR